MATFSSTTKNTAIVPASRTAVWKALTDPDLLPDLTPLLHSIEVVGDQNGDPLWQWQMSGIDVLGVKVSPCFTERMRLTPEERINYHHAPPPGADERAGVEGWYTLADHEEGVELGISLTISIRLPLPRVSAPAVTRVMDGVMARTGDRFSANLLRHLGVD
ncbi:MAG: SRPBCC family protein [Nocardioides sp.]|nr:SRPBCC family protein [Nocardioides sp.]